jgi:hypothetical protein
MREMAKQPYPFWTTDELDKRRLESRKLFKQAWTASILHKEFRDLEAICTDEVIAFMKASDNLRALLADSEFFDHGTKKAAKQLVAPARFMTVPLLSEDNLEVLGEDRMLADVIVDFINPERFPWLKQGRAPTRGELKRAVEATAELWALQRVATAKRIAAAARQEDLAKECLTDPAVGLTLLSRKEVQARAKDAPSYDSKKGIENHNLHYLLRPAEFTSEFKVAGAKCDLPVLLPSGFFLPLECKVSGSAVNSIKRLIRETVGKRRAWRDEFGRQPYTGAVISGVFSMTTLRAAQDEGMLLFFEHELDALGEFVKQGGKPRPK